MNKSKINIFYNFFRTHKITLLIYFMIGFILLMCLYFLRFHKHRSLQDTSFNYEKFINLDLNDKNLTDVINFIDKNHNIYGNLVALSLTKYYVKKNNIQNAINILIHNVQYAIDPNIQSIMAIQIARLQLEQNQLNESIQTLQKIKDKSWINIVSDIYGDALFSKGDINKANIMWSKGIYYNESLTIPLKQILKMKINNLNIK